VDADVLEKTVLVRRGLDAHAAHEATDREVVELGEHRDGVTERQQGVGQLTHRHQRLDFDEASVDVDVEHVAEVAEVDLGVGLLVLAHAERHGLPARACGAHLSLLAVGGPCLDLGRDLVHAGRVLRLLGAAAHPEVDRVAQP